MRIFYLFKKELNWDVKVSLRCSRQLSLLGSVLSENVFSQSHFTGKGFLNEKPLKIKWAWVNCMQSSRPFVCMQRSHLFPLPANCITATSHLSQRTSQLYHPRGDDTIGSFYETNGLFLWDNWLGENSERTTYLIILLGSKFFTFNPQTHLYLG